MLLPSGGDLGRVVRPHQGRRRGHRARADDGGPRSSLAGSCSLRYLARRRWDGVARSSELRTALAPGLVLGALNAALPFWLVAWGEKHIDSSIAGNRAGDGGHLHVPPRRRFLPHEARRIGADPRGRASGSSGSPCSPASTRGEAGWRSPGRSRSSSRPCQLRGAGASTGNSGADSAPAPCSRPARCSPERADPAAVRARSAAPTQAPGRRGDRLAARADLLRTTFAQLILFRMLRLFGAAGSPWSRT